MMETERLTFKDLLVYESHKYGFKKIIIPKIQRDYAQGRNDNNTKRIRTKFLNVLCRAITDENSSPLTLDFIYGDIENPDNKEDSAFLTPLDGQQRLTTLYLLHWYIAKKEKISSDESEFLNRFSYETRFSSRDFCEALLEYNPDFSASTLSSDIENQYWFQYEWGNDPTIISMLVMIDAIHERLGETDSTLWNMLVSHKQIGFYFLPLKEMGLSDELYVKMNSRGKPLTQFEHFKAEFGEIIKEQGDERYKEISYKFDVTWTNMLFPFRGENSIIDDEFMRYYYFIGDILCYKLGLKREEDEFLLAKKLYSKTDSNGVDNPDAALNLNFFEQSFDCWCDISKTKSIDIFFNDYFYDGNYEHGKVKLYQQDGDLNLFKECCDNYGDISGNRRLFPLTKTLLLYAILIGILNRDKITPKLFKHRIRIIRNLIENSSDEIRDDYMKTLLNEAEIIMLDGIIPEVKTGDIGFNKRQKTEEREKDEWIKSNFSMSDDLYKLEDNTLLKGCIAVVGLDNPSNFAKFTKLFNNCDKDLINRALLSIGNYSQQPRYWNWQIGSQKNDSVWQNLFHPSDRQKGFEQTKKTINSLLNNLDEELINNSQLKDVVNKYIKSPDTIKDWRYYFIKYDSMRFGNYGMYFYKKRSAEWWQNHISAGEYKYDIIMMNTAISTSGHHWNVFLFTLSRLPDFRIKLDLGDYGNRLRLRNTDIVVDCTNDKYIVWRDNSIIKEYSIKQLNGVDIEDRIDIGIKIINEWLNI